MVGSFNDLSISSRGAGGRGGPYKPRGLFDLVYFQYDVCFQVRFNKKIDLIMRRYTIDLKEDRLI